MCHILHASAGEGRTDTEHVLHLLSLMCSALAQATAVGGIAMCHNHHHPFCFVGMLLVSRLSPLARACVIFFASLYCMVPLWRCALPSGLIHSVGDAFMQWH